MTTSTVPTPEAFAYWREMICATFVRLAAEPLTAGRFSGRIEHVPVGDLELSAVMAGSQHVRRTRSLIAQGKEEYLLAARIRSASAIGPAAPAAAAARAPCSLRPATRDPVGEEAGHRRGQECEHIGGHRRAGEPQRDDRDAEPREPVNSRARRGLARCHRDGRVVHVGAFAYGPFELRCGLASASRSRGRVAPV
jgi:hypothetical protein